MKLSIVQILLLFSAWKYCWAASITSTTQISIGGIDYFLHPRIVGTLSANNGTGLIPFTAVTTGNASIFSSDDDVWTPDFSQYVYGNTSAFPSAQAIGGSEVLAQGPYVLDSLTGDIYQPWRLYPDHNQAYLQAVYYESDSGFFHPLSAGVSGAASLAIAVPSRLYYTPTADKPLAGLRISVKDLYDLAGIKTSFGSRSYYSLQQTANATAVAIQRLIDAGAIIVGKDKLSAWAVGGHLLTQNPDYLLPFNPRADEYLTPGSSSEGSASAVSSYDWLDASVGSDTGGSIRGPAGIVGCYGNRPTYGAVSLQGAKPLATSMDTCGIIARNPVIFSRILKSLYQSEEYYQYPKRILAPSNIFGSSNSTADRTASKFREQALPIYESFIPRLAAFLNATVDNSTMGEIWNATSGFGNMTASEAAENLESTYVQISGIEQSSTIGFPFIQQYQQNNENRLPYIQPGILDFWNIVPLANRAIYADLLSTKQKYARWLQEYVVPSDNLTCSQTLFLDTIDASISDNRTNIDRSAGIRFCEMLDSNFTTSLSYPLNKYYVAGMGGFPQYVIPLANIPLSSYFENYTEKAPVGIQIAAAPGCDFMLLNLIEALYTNGILQTVTTGRDNGLPLYLP